MANKRAKPEEIVTKLHLLQMLGRPVIPPFLRGLGRRIYAAIFSFWAGVIPPLPMLGRS